MPRIFLRASASIVLAAVVATGLSPAVSAEPGPLPPFIGTEVEQDEILEVISTAQSRSFKPVGHTSVVLRMRTVERVTAALKVRSHQLRRGYQYEIAAYRIGRLLGLDNVPPAIFRRATWGEIRRRFHRDALDRRDAVRRAVLWDDDGSVPAAAIYWIKGLRYMGPENQAAWRSWLRGGEIPPSKTALARDLSTMVVFDFLIGNWDRFSGGNLSIDASGRRAYLRDHDRSFSSPLPERQYRKLLERLNRTERFSETLVRRLSTLDEATIGAELARDPSHEAAPLLSDEQIADILDRRATILSYIAALIEERGAEHVLVFP